MNKLIINLIIVFIFSINIFAQNYGDKTLADVREKDRTSRDEKGKLLTLSASEHSFRADVYMANRVFPNAREHWQKLIENYPNDVNMPKAFMGIGRSYMWEREYALAITFFDDAIKTFPYTKEGRESLAFKGACQVRLGKNVEAAKTYEQYTIMYPTGERIETSYLNIIDALREAKKYDDANLWVEKARQRFMGLPTETNALFARMRMEFFQQKFDKVIVTADTLKALNDFRDTMTSNDEVTYLKAFALEKIGRTNEAIAVYSSIPNNITSYYAGLAQDRLSSLNAPKIKLTSYSVNGLLKDFPAPYRNELLRYAKPRGIDPRFVLAIMKQESTFRPTAKSPAAARGLLQLVLDTALKYNKQAGFPNLKDDELYNPTINIAIGSIYIGELKKEFDNLYEAVAASYNGGEDNAARWLNRSKPKDPAIFTAEVGFAESKAYVFKVMGNYRVYRELYTEDLMRK
ncbi:MAG: transglycosylase SLT domain-containing protein [Pyrinomonadaceae bacterium]|nr:transglycosylase SLT domain-containing protein [Pyrinomonadaceae bacterium]